MGMNIYAYRLCLDPDADVKSVILGDHEWDSGRQAGDSEILHSCANAMWEAVTVGEPDDDPRGDGKVWYSRICGFPAARVIADSVASGRGRRRFHSLIDLMESNADVYIRFE